MRLTALSTYTPADRMDTAGLSARTGIPADVLVEKFGYTGKYVSAEGEHVSDMSMKAALPLVEGASGPIGTVIYCGSSLKDHGMWSVAAKVADGLGLNGALGFEVMGQCAGFLIGIWTANALLAVDPDAGDVLLVGASKDSQAVDYDDLSVKSVFNFGDGGAAIRVSRASAGARILAHAGITDGRFHDAVMVPAGGTVEPATAETVAAGRHRALVKPGLSLRDEVAPMFIAIILRAAESACAQAGIRVDEVDHVIVQNQIPSVHRSILDGLGIDEDRCEYFGGHGHMSSLDPVFALADLARAGRIAPGERLLLLAAGLGYTASALLVEWGDGVDVRTTSA